MNQDNARLALIITGIWGSLIIVGIAIEAIIHDGAIADTIVKIFGGVLATIVLAVAGILSISKLTEAHVATNPVAAAAAVGLPAVAAVTGSLLASDPGSPDTADAAPVGAGVD